MNDLRETVRDAICRVAPDVDAANIPDDVEFREAADLDSMDLLAVLGEVGRMTGIEVPEADYDAITTIGDFAAYLGARLGA